jgi:adenosylcobinamide kinase / adenosylcobinamide-phosphate guanylyltransferase
MTSRTLILGGARSGKSTEAERRIAELARSESTSNSGFVLYIATGGTRAGDEEWAERISLHQSRRPASWETIETAKAADVAAVLRSADRPVLVDCLTLWLTSAMDEAGAWDEATWHGGGQAALAAHVDELAETWRQASVPVIAVSNEVGLGIVPESAAVRRFRDEQGRLNQRIAAGSDSVVLMVAGIAVTVR